MEAEIYTVEIYHCYDAGFSYKEDLVYCNHFLSVSSALRHISDLSCHYSSFLGIKFDYFDRVFQVRFVP